MSAIIGLRLRLRPEKCHFAKDLGHTVMLTANVVNFDNAKGKVRELTW